MAFATDDFNRANGAPGANWTSSTAFRMQIQSNRFAANGSGDPALEWWNGFVPADDQYSECSIEVFDTVANLGIGPCVRAATGADTCYWFFHNTVDEYRLVRMSAGGIAASLGSYTAGTPATGDVMRIEAEGTALRCYVNGVERISTTDATLSSGRVGVRSLISNVVAAVDNWDGGDLVEPTAAVTGTIASGATEADIVAGGETVIVTLTDATYVPAAGFSDWTLVGSAENAGGANAALTVDLSGITMQQGDLVLVAYGCVSTADRVMAVTTAGYTVLFEDYSNDTRDANGEVAYKIMGATPDTDVVLGNPGGASTESFVAVVQVWRGADQSTPIDAATTEAEGIDSSVSNSPSITTVTNGALVVSIGINSGAAADVAVTAPAGYTNLANHSTDPGTSIRVMMASKVVATAGAEDPAAWGGITTTTSDAWLGFTVALRPAATTPFATAAPDLTAGLDSAQSEATGWNAEVRDAGAVSWARTSDTVATGTLTAAPSYNITAQETITVTVPASILTSGGPITATPTFTVDPAAGGAAEVTPGTAALTATGFAPTLQLPRTVTPGAAALTATGFAPAVQTPRMVTPGTSALTATGFAPTVSVTAHVSVTPGSAALTATGFAPAVTVSDHKVVTPGTAALAATGFAPTVTIGINVFPGTGQLTATGFAPTVIAPMLATPGTGVLAATGFAPTVTAGTSVTPQTGALIVTGFAPSVTVSNHQRVTPGTGALDVTGFAPTVLTPRTVTPGAGQLTATGFAPSIQIGTVVRPATGELVATGFAPSVLAAVSVQPGTAILIAEGFEPSVLVAPVIVTVIVIEGVRHIELPVLVGSLQPFASVTGRSPSVFVRDASPEPSARELAFVTTARGALPYASVTLRS